MTQSQRDGRCLRIGLNLLYLIPEVVGGTETYARSLLQALVEMDSGNEFFVFVNSESEQMPLPVHPNVKRVVCRVNATNRPARHLWEQGVLPLRVLRCRLDVLHSLGYVGPIAAPCPSIVTVHDTIYWRLREDLPAIRRMVVTRLCQVAVRAAQRVIAVSDFAKREIVNTMRVRPSKITVIHEGVEHAHCLAETEKWEDVQRSYDISEPYVVAFGSGELKHKNLLRLVRAFSSACSDLPHCLVLAGRVPEELKREAVRENRLRLVGYVPRPHLSAIVRHADLFVMPSLYEGFGLPVVEAQSLGTPVACSSCSALPEVAGSGAWFFDPVSVDDMATAIRRCLIDGSLRSQLRAMGTRNAARFSWRTAAEATLDVYCAVSAGLRARSGEQTGFQDLATRD